MKKRLILFIIPVLILIIAGFFFIAKDFLKADNQETIIYYSPEFSPDSQGTLRVVVLAHDKNSPVEGAKIHIKLKEVSSGKVYYLYEGITDKSGSLDFNFRYPLVNQGEFLLIVDSASTFGKDKITRKLYSLNKGKITLLTDKHIYKPNETVQPRQIRQLANMMFSLKLRT